MPTKIMNHAAYQKSLKKLSVMELNFTIQDANQVMAAWRDHPNGSYYSDEIIYCQQELKRRREKCKT